MIVKPMGPIVEGESRVALAFPMHVSVEKIRISTLPSSEFEIEVTLRSVCRLTGKPVNIEIRYHRSPFNGDDSLAEIARLIRESISAALDHEVRELLLVDGKRLFDPHRNARGRS